MNELINIKNKEGQLLVSSREVANNFGKRHDHTLRDIRSILSELWENNTNRYFREAKYTNSRGKTYPEYLITKEGLKLFIDRSRKTPELKPVIDLYNNMGGEEDTTVLASRFEDSFMNKLNQVLDELGIGLKREYSLLDYRLDGYIKEYNLAIEYDEAHHKYQLDEDRAREKDIEKAIGCKFIRLDYKDTDATNIGKVVNIIIGVKK